MKAKTFPCSVRIASSPHPHAQLQKRFLPPTQLQVSATLSSPASFSPSCFALTPATTRARTLPALASTNRPGLPALASTNRPGLDCASHNSSSNPAGTLPALTACQVCQRVDRLHCCSRAHGHRHDLVQSRATGPVVPCSRQYWVQVGGVFNLLISLSLKPLPPPPSPPFIATPLDALSSRLWPLIRLLLLQLLARLGGRQSRRALDAL